MRQITGSRWISAALACAAIATAGWLLAHQAWASFALMLTALAVIVSLVGFMPGSRGWWFETKWFLRSFWMGQAAAHRGRVAELRNATEQRKR